MSFQFSDDTGSSAPTLFQSDLHMLRGLSPNMAPNPPTGPIVSISPGGLVHAQGYMLDFRVIGRQGAMTIWYRLKCNVHADSDANMWGLRLSGAWWRNVLFVAEAPDNRHNLYVATSKLLLANNLPQVNLNEQKPVPIAVGYPPRYRGPVLPLGPPPPGPAVPPGGRGAGCGAGRGVRP